jgi:hypothetical protein
MYTDLCIEYVEGRINDENIVTSQRVTNCKVDCPHSCQNDNVCSNCCNCLIGIGGIPACRKNVCRCLLIPPIGQFNNVPSPLPTIAN